MDEVNVLELHQMVQNNGPNKKKEKKKKKKIQGRTENPNLVFKKEGRQHWSCPKVAG